MIVFGGDFAEIPLNDVWALWLGGTPRWERLRPEGTPPSARINHTAIYDPARNRMIVFGGELDETARVDVWALSLGGSPAWEQLSAAGTSPAARSGHSAIYDPVRDRMVVFGGIGLFGLPGGAWALSLGIEALAGRELDVSFVRP